MTSFQLLSAWHQRDKSKFPKIEFDLTDTAKSNIDSFLLSSRRDFDTSMKITNVNQ